MQPNSSYGAAISSQGIPVAQASDNQKVLDTRWVTLDILEEPTYNNTIIEVTNSNGFWTGFIPIHHHGLGRSPVFEAVITSNSYSSNVNVSLSNLNIYADYQDIYLIPSTLSSNIDVETVSVTVSISIRVFSLPIERGFTAPNVKVTPRQGNVVSNYGAKFLNGNDSNVPIGIATPEQLNFSTTLRPLNIMQYGIATSSSGNVSIAYNYGGEFPLFDAANYYPPQTLNVGGGLNQNTLIAPFGKDVPRASVTPTQITLGGIQTEYGNNAAYILFKDPLGSAV